MTSFRTLLVFLSLLSCFTLMHASPALAANTEGAGKFIESVGNQALAVVTNGKLSKDQKQDRLEKIFDANVDFPWVARFVMGASWRKASEAQKARYVKAYEQFEVWHYTSRFTDYNSGSFKITGSRDDGAGESTISMAIQPGDPQAEPVLVDYRVRKEGAGYKIFDITIEGVSMLTTQRQEFAAVIANNGIDYLIDQLNAKAKAKAEDN